MYENYGSIPSFKVIMLGDSGVGKTSIVLRRTKGSFTFQMNPTIGTSHIKTNVKINEQTVELKIWDTAGQEQFASLVSMYTRGTDVCIIVASVVDESSIQSIDKWKNRLNETGEFPPIIIALNKIDMEESSEEITILSEKFSSQYNNVIFVSAKTGEGIDSLFISAAEEALRSAQASQQKDTENPPPSDITLREEENKCSCSQA
ncbi:small GTP-binding protein [Histomonas meleagridis]|uniref:small GTP-binding protein n=1 Tax=Histomonas meleagridis TaxID=135588 RepID=UPI0035599AB9|nr:small GTP-binding protein [Histomonas meleagridis]KAH0803182.1 small GTP-binding protein [Histomonas meleagridis]